MKKVFNILGIYNFIAIKKQYNECRNSNDFYKYLNKRLKDKSITGKTTPKEIANFLVNELNYHFKEYSQYQ
jgi:hypothetical protein